MKSKEKVKHQGWDIGWPLFLTSLYLGLGLLYTGIYIGTTVTMNAGAIGLQAGMEYLQRGHKQKYAATLEEVGTVSLIQTHGKLYRGTIELPDGRELKVYDSPRVLEGKLFANNVLPHLEIGEPYEFSIIETSTGHTVLNAQKVQEANK